MLAEPLDCLLIASPNHCHLGSLEEIAAIRPLPVLVEKPLFTDPAERAPAAFGALSRAGLGGDGIPLHAAVARLIEEAAGGDRRHRMLTLREHRFPFLDKVGDWNRFNRATGGTLVEKCCHFFDLMRLILADEPVRVMASGGQAVNHLDEAYDGETSGTTAYVIVDFARGARAMLELCMFAEGSDASRKRSSCGRPRTARSRPFVPGPGRFWPSHLGAPPVAQGDRLAPPPEGAARSTSPSIRRFSTRAITTVRPSISTSVRSTSCGAAEHRGHLEDGARAVAMGLAAQVSATEGPRRRSCRRRVRSRRPGRGRLIPPRGGKIVACPIRCCHGSGMVQGTGPGSDRTMTG